MAARQETVEERSWGVKPCESISSRHARTARIFDVRPASSAFAAREESLRLVRPATGCLFEAEVDDTRGKIFFTRVLRGTHTKYSRFCRLNAPTERCEAKWEKVGEAKRVKMKRRLRAAENWKERFFFLITIPLFCFSRWRGCRTEVQNMYQRNRWQRERISVENRRRSRLKIHHFFPERTSQSKRGKLYNKKRLIIYKLKKKSRKSERGKSKYNDVFESKAEKTRRKKQRSRSGR